MWLEVNYELVLDIDDLGTDISVLVVEHLSQFISVCLRFVSLELEIPIIHNWVVDISRNHNHITNLDRKLKDEFEIPRLFGGITTQHVLHFIGETPQFIELSTDSHLNAQWFQIDTLIDQM